MLYPDTWRRAGVHWHAYVESRGEMREGSDRVTRLARSPEHTFTAPDAVADWVAQMTRKHASQEPKTGDGWGRVANETSLADDYDRDMRMLSCGHSLCADIKTTDDRVCLWLEAVTPEQCPEVHE